MRLSPSFREGSDVREQEAPNTTAISIHAPAKGATARSHWFEASKALFQSTLPRRERRSAQVFIVGVQRNFNPRSREGSDVCTLVSMVVAKSFQSTLPRRERHITSAAAAGLAHFNPRSREGSDGVCAGALG